MMWVAIDKDEMRVLILHPHFETVQDFCALFHSGCAVVYSQLVGCWECFTLGELYRLTGVLPVTSDSVWEFLMRQQVSIVNVPKLQKELLTRNSGDKHGYNAPTPKNTSAEIEAKLSTLLKGIIMAKKELTPEQIAEAEQAKAQAKAEREVAKAQKVADKEAAKAQKLAEQEATKASKQAEREAKKAEREAKKAEAPAKEPRIIQNGITAPKPDSKNGRAWAVFDAESAKLGRPVVYDEISPICESLGLNLTNVRYGLRGWMIFHGLKK